MLLYIGVFSMKKDILTIQKIKSDYRKLFYSSIKTVILMPIILVLLITLIIYLFSCLENKNLFLLLEILIISPPIFMSYICLATIFETYKDYNTIKKDLFKIVTDTLISSEEKATYIGSAFAASFSRPYTLNFASYGQYCILNGENYSSSELYTMNDKGVFNYSTVGDIFYLILDNKNRILLVYNTKLFELSD